MPGIVKEVSATFIATTTSLSLSGTPANTRNCAAAGNIAYREKTYKEPGSLNLVSLFSSVCFSLSIFAANCSLEFILSFPLLLSLFKASKAASSDSRHPGSLSKLFF
jgi:hypothetical protein